MKWIIFTGTWRLTNAQVENDVRDTVREVLERGDGIVTGGATGVDYFAMDEAIKFDPSCKSLRVIIPTSLENYILDYKTNWCQKPVTLSIITDLEKILSYIKMTNPASLMEMKHGPEITQEHYNLHHNEEVAMSDEVYAFQVNNSTGTQDTIDKALKAGLAVAVHKKYTIEE